MNNAPVIYFEKVGAIDLVPGIIHIELTSRITSRIAAGRVESEDVPVANLRCNIVAAHALISMLTFAIDEHQEAVSAKVSNVGVSPRIS